MMEQIFVSSVQKELQAERCAVRDFVHSIALLRQFFPRLLLLNGKMAHKRLNWFIAS